MANNSAVVKNAQSKHFQQGQHHCKQCGLFFDTSKSLDVHLHYHQENLLNKWATQATQNGPGGSDETNNNNTKNNNNKRGGNGEFASHTIAAAADSSDSMLKTPAGNNKSPESFTGSRTTPPETSTSFGHPPTPQSYTSAPSPYQNAEASTFSPGYQNFQIKSERLSPLSHQYPVYGNQQHYVSENQYFMMDAAQHQHQQLGYPQDYPLHKIPAQSPAFRYHPYQHSVYERNPQVSSSSPAYPSQNPQPTPSPSPKQCDKCGCVCDSAAQLLDHLNHAHPSTPAIHMANPFQHNQHFQFSPLVKQELKGEDEPQTEILDLDSHKVHQVFQSSEEEDNLKQQNGESNPHSVSTMLNQWPNGSPQQKMYSHSDQRSFISEQKGFTNGQEKLYQGNMSENKMFQQEQKLFQPHQMSPPDFVTNGVTTTSQDSSPQVMGPGYRPFDHIPPQPNPPVISSTQIPNPVSNNTLPALSSKGANWKSNEARRPKTYNCSACNKWFTSSGHLKRHYNTTLHKNAVKSSGQPDPATMPISLHHHPGRDSVGNRTSDSTSQSPDPIEDNRVDEANSFDRSTQMLQQPPSGPYDRQPATTNNIGPQSSNLHSPIMSQSSSLTNLSTGSPPNGDAGPSVTSQDHSRGLLSISTPSTPQITPLSPMVATMGTSQLSAGFNLLNPVPPPHLMGMPMDNHHHLQQQSFPTMSQPSSIPANYPNGLAPHVMPITAINNQPALTSLTTIGESAYTAEFIQYGLQSQQFLQNDPQPLPSFAQFQSHRYGLLLAAGYPVHDQANVGGMGPVTDPNHHQGNQQVQQLVAFSPDSPPFLAEPPQEFQDTDGDYDIEIGVMGDNSETILPDDPIEYDTSPPHNNNNNNKSNNKNHVLILDQQILRLKPMSPIRDEIKRECENSSPLITSTGSPLATTKKTALPGVHKCFDCDKMFNKACYLTQHNKTFHCGDKPYKCGRCGKRFSSDNNYQEHLAKHAGDKPHKCELCPKQFNHKTDLRRHMCLHTGQKPYQCDHCGKGFIRKDHMLKHTETHRRKPHSSNTKQQPLEQLQPATS